ncbi:unnamed protein product, partial [Didymodactylos carnosus]
GDRGGFRGGRGGASRGFSSHIFWDSERIAIGHDEDIRKQFPGEPFAQKIDAYGCCIIPGNMRLELVFKC